MNYKLEKDIRQYCAVNGLDYEEYLNSLIKRAYMIDKYGERPGGAVSIQTSSKKTRKHEYVLPTIKPEEETRKEEKNKDNEEEEKKPPIFVKPSKRKLKVVD